MYTDAQVRPALWLRQRLTGFPERNPAPKPAWREEEGESRLNGIQPWEDLWNLHMQKGTPNAGVWRSSLCRNNENNELRQE
jgi:hypothetical protein